MSRLSRQCGAIDDDDFVMCFVGCWRVELAGRRRTTDLTTDVPRKVGSVDSRLENDYFDFLISPRRREESNFRSRSSLLL